MSENRRKEDKRYLANIKLLHDIQRREEEEFRRKKAKIIAKAHAAIKQQSY